MLPLAASGLGHRSGTSDGRQPASNVSVHFTDQTTGGPSYNGYTLTTGWTNNPSFPSGTMTSTLQVSYPDDSGGDWTAGSVTKPITYQFDTGTTHVLVQKQNYDARTGTDDGAMPLSVSPGAEVAAMPKTVAGDTPRLVLLTLSGSEVPADIPDGTREPSPEDHSVWEQAAGTWSSLQDTSWDVTLEESGPTAFRLTLIDDSGKPVTDGAFNVYRCPRGDHQTPNQSLAPCALDVVTSQNGAIASLPVNPNGVGDGGSRGYLGIELTKAPSNPGTYYVLVESLDKSYRIRRESQFSMGTGSDDEYRGAFLLCTVMGGEILDENFQRIDPFTVNQPTRAYVRYTNPSGAGSTVTVDLHSFDDQGSEVDEAPGVTLTRVGSSAAFLSQPIELLPAWVEADTAPYLHVDRSPDGDVEVTPAGKDASGASMASTMSAAAATSRRPSSRSCLAWTATKSGATYIVPLGLAPLPLEAYWGFGYQVPRRPYLCSPVADPPDCPASATAFVPLEQVGPMSLLEGDVEGPDQVARLENEPGPTPQRPNDPPAGWYLRPIRTTVLPNGMVATKADGSPRVTNGTIKVNAPVASAKATAEVKITWPSTLGCCASSSCTLACKTLYDSPPATNPTTVVDLISLVLQQADANGIPPQYLIAQAAAEALTIPGLTGYLNTYSFRYEPTSYDFKKATGDHGTSADMGDNNPKRRLFHPPGNGDRGEALFNLGITNSPSADTGGNVTYLPCECTIGPNDPDGDPIVPPDTLWPDACIVAQGVLPPKFENAHLIQDPANPFGYNWLIPNLTDDIKLQLGVQIYLDGQTQEFTQIFSGDFSTDPMVAATQFKVQPESTGSMRVGRITFGSAWDAFGGANLMAQYRRRPVWDNTPPDDIGFHRSFTEGSTPQQLAILIRQQNPSTKLVPPDPLSMTIRGWCLWTATDNSPLKPIANFMRRYWQRFEYDQLWQLMRSDPSFDVQGQWFAAASYGIMQQIPESARTTLYKVNNGIPAFSDTDRSYIRQTIFDPLGEVPNPRNPERLFDPAVCIQLGATKDVKANVTDELDETLVNEETPCTVEKQRSQCTWERWWKRRFRMFNSGSESMENQAVVDYADKIVRDSSSYVPVPQP